MKLLGSFLLALAVLALRPTVTEASVFTYDHDDEPLFSISFPESWFLDTDFVEEAKAAGTYRGGEPQIRIIEAMPGDGSKLWFGAWVIPEAETLEEGLEYIASLDGELFTDVESSESEETALGTMAARTFYGTARREGEEVEFAVALFEPRENVIAVALYVGRPQTWKQHQAELEAIVGSIEPTRN